MELVVVILVMALLAAVGIFAFNQVSSNARIAAAKAELTTVAKAAVAELALREASAFDAVWVTPLYGEVITEVEAGETAAGGVFTPLGPDEPLTAAGQYGLAFKDLTGQVNATQGIGVTFATWVDGTVVSVSASAAGTIADHKGENTAAWADDALNTAVQQRTNLATNPSFETVSGAAVVHTNYYPDPGTTKAGSNSGWPGTSNTSTFSVANVPYSASGTAARQTWTTRETATGDIRPLSSAWRAFANEHVGERITAVFKARTSHVGTARETTYGANGNVTTAIRGVARSASQPIGPDTTAVIWATVDVLEPLNGNVTAPHLGISQALPTEAGAWGDVFEVDFYVGEYQPSRSWFSGSYSPDPDLMPEWSGAANDSASVLKADTPAREPGATTAPTADVQRVIRSNQWKQSGSWAARIVPTGTSRDTFIQLGNWNEFDVSTFKRGHTYRVSATMWLPEPQVSPEGRARRIVAHFGGIESGTSVRSDAAPNSAGSHRLSVTFTVPGDATWSDCRLYNGASAGNGDVWWDDLVIEDVTGRVPADDSYFDGDTPGTARATYRWSGAPHRSTSTVLAW